MDFLAWKFAHTKLLPIFEWHEQNPSQRARKLKHHQLNDVKISNRLKTRVFEHAPLECLDAPLKAQTSPSHLLAHVPDWWPVRLFVAPPSFHTYITYEPYPQIKGKHLPFPKYPSHPNKFFETFIIAFMQVFLDNSVVFGEESGHLQHSTHDKRDEKGHLSLNPGKCAFIVFNGMFLGHIISNNGIALGPSKAKPILEALAPTNAQSLLLESNSLDIVFVDHCWGESFPILKLMLYICNVMPIIK